MVKTAQTSVVAGLINNQTVQHEQTVAVIAPDTQQATGRFYAMNATDVKQAFQAARTAYHRWRQQSLAKRIALVERWAAVLTTHQQEVVDLMVREVSKPVTAAQAEFNRTLRFVTETVAESRRLFPVTRLGDGFNTPGKVGIFLRVPRGVVLAIAPFNYPLNLAVSKIIPAVITGNTVVFKPPTNGTLLGCLLGQCFLAAQFPPGVVNVVVGRGADIGHALTTNPEIDVIGFTGSFPVGQQLLVNHPSAHTFLELGGKDVLVVLADADLSRAASAIVTGGLAYSGQRCTAIKLVACDERVADQLVALVVERVRQLKVGRARDGGFIVPLINQQSADYVMALITDAVAHGATVVVGNRCERNLVWPTVLDHVNLNMRLASEEQFGPVIPIMRFTNPATISQIVNHTPAGLQAAIFTQDFVQAWQLAQDLEVGTVNWNGQSQRGPDCFPFLGVKASGYGTAQSIRDSLLTFTRPKGFVINNLNPNQQ